MKRSVAVVVALAAILLAGLAGGCATLRQVAALRSVTFSFDHVSDVSLAGVPVSGTLNYTDVSAGDLARLLKDVSSGHVPLHLVAHVRAANPASNAVAARLVNLSWKFYIDEQETVSGMLDHSFSIAPGDSADVPVHVELDLPRFFNGGARNLFDLAVGVAGGRTTKALRLDLVPTIETSLGPISYPSPIVIRRPAS